MLGHIDPSKWAFREPCTRYIQKVQTAAAAAAAAHIMENKFGIRL